MGKKKYLSQVIYFLRFKPVARMIALCKFIFFNVILGLTDVSTDLATFFDLSNEEHPLWAALTASWMTTPFCIHAVIFLAR